MTWRKRITQTIAWVAVAAAILMLIAILLFGFLQTGFARRKLASLVSSMLSAGTDLRWDFGEIEGRIPFDIRLKYLAIRDGEGEWLRAEAVTLRWSLAALLRGRIHVNECSVAWLRLDRIPEQRKKERQGEMRPFPWPLPQIPPFIAEKVVLGRCELGETVLGREAAFSLEGGMGLSDQGRVADASLRIELLNDPRAVVSLVSRLAGTPAALSLSAHIREERGGVLAGVLGLGGKGPILVELRGEGPLDSWTGRLMAKVEELGALEAGIGLRLGEEVRLTGEGRISSSVNTVMGEALDFSLDAGYGKGGVVSLHRAHLKTRDAAVDLSGGYDLRTAMLDVRFDAVLHDLTPLDTLAKRHIDGRLSAQGSISGPLLQPGAVLSLQLFDAGFAGMIASMAAATFHIDLSGPMRPEFPGIHIAGEGMVEDFRHPGLERLPLDRVQWSLAATIPSGKEITVQRLGISAAGISLAYSGTVEPEGWLIKGNAEAEVMDMKALSPFWGRELSGGVTLRAGLEGGVLGRFLSANVEGTIRSLAPLPPVLGQIAGDVWKYRAKLRLDQGMRLFVSGLDIRTNGARLTGEASLDLADSDLRAACILHIPRLSVLSPYIGRPLAGGAVLDIALSGPLMDPGVEVSARVRDFLMEEMRVGDFSAHVRAGGLASGPKGHIRLDLHPEEGDVQVDTDFSLDGRGLALAAITLTAPGAQGGGDLFIDLTGPGIEGTLTGEFSDLSLIGPLRKADIARSGELNVRFFTEETVQAVGLDCAVKSLATPLGMAGKVQVHATVSDPFGSPHGSFRIDAQGVQRGGLTVSEVSIRLEGDPARAVFSGNAHGMYGEAFAVAAGGNVTRSPGEVRVQVAVCEGSFAGAPFSLDNPLLFSRSEDRFAVEEFNLRVAGGLVQAFGAYDPASIDIDVSFDGISLEMLRLIGYPDLSGAAKGHIRMTGTPGNPGATLDISIDKAGIQRLAVSKGNPVSMAAQVVLEDGVFRAHGSIEGPFERPIRADLRMPMTLSLSPFAFNLPPQGEIRGHLTAEADLAPLIALVNLEEQNLEGRVNVALTVEGTVDAPKVTGRADMARGMYENLSTGTLLKDITLVITGDGQVLTLQEARATDGDKGTLSGRGHLLIAPAQGIDLWAEIVLNDLAVVSRFDMQAITSGSLILSGTPGNMRLAGSVRVSPAELRIPDRLPPEITDLEVIEINRPGQEHKPETPSRASPGNGLGLDLAIDLPGRVFVRGRGLDSEWRGRLHVGGTTGSPVITGDLSSMRGSFDLFGKRFSLARGGIHFDGSVPPAPSLDVTAGYQRRDLSASLRISGSPSALSMSLESEPVLPSDEILARVLFGRSVAEMTPLQALRLAQAAGALSGRGGVLDFMGRTRRFIGVDQLVIEQSEEGITSVSVGKYLSEGVYVEMEEGIGTRSSTLSVEVELTPNITVESKTGSDSRGGIGLNWKWDY